MSKQNFERRLAAIMFTDIEIHQEYVSKRGTSYSSLEKRSIIQPLTDQNNGVFAKKWALEHCRASIQLSMQ